jgi:acetyl-CoA carboxylase carboxyltransferase component
MFPGRRGAGRIFHNQVALSGKVPQICCLFGPSAAGGAYIPSFCDLIIMVEGNASMYLGSPRMAEMVVGEKVSLEDMGGARMHCTVSGVGDLLAHDDAEAIELAKLYFSYLPVNWQSPRCRPTTRSRRRTPDLRVVPERESQPFDIHDVIDGLVDEDSFFEIKPLFAPELVIGFGRGWRADASASSPTTRRSRAGCSSPTAPTRPPVSSGCVMPIRSR